MYPLPSHTGALPAAQAYLCVPEDRREAAADWLYSAPEESLSRTGVLPMADALGVSRADLARCMTSPETQAALARDKEIYDSIGARGLPLTYVGPRMIIGFNPDRIESAVKAELAGGRASLKVVWLFVALGALFAAALFFTWRMKASADEQPALVQQ
jgi:hypothetical protein